MGSTGGWLSSLKNEICTMRKERFLEKIAFVFDEKLRPPLLYKRYLFTNRYGFLAKYYTFDQNGSLGKYLKICS